MESFGAFGDVSASPEEQIDAAIARARDYMSAACTDDDAAAIKAALKQTVEKILKRARQKVKDAEENLQDTKDRANKGTEAA